MSWFAWSLMSAGATSALACDCMVIGPPMSVRAPPNGAENLPTNTVFTELAVGELAPLGTATLRVNGEVVGVSEEIVFATEALPVTQRRWVPVAEFPPHAAVELEFSSGRLDRFLIGEVRDAAPPVWDGAASLESVRNEGDEGACGPTWSHTFSLTAVQDDLAPEHVGGVGVPRGPNQGALVGFDGTLVAWFSGTCGGDPTLLDEFDREYDVVLVDAAGNLSEVQTLSTTGDISGVATDADRGCATSARLDLTSLPQLLRRR